MTTTNGAPLAKVKLNWVYVTGIWGTLAAVVAVGLAIGRQLEAMQNIQTMVLKHDAQIEALKLVAQDNQMTIAKLIAQSEATRRDIDRLVGLMDRSHDP